MPALAFFVLLPLIEIGLFILAGSLIGFWPTFLLLMATSVLGVMLLRGGRGAGLQQMAQAQKNGDPAAALGGMAARQMAGMLLVLPGFLTDALGLVLLLPPVQKALVTAAARKFGVQAGGLGAGFGPGFGAGFGATGFGAGPTAQPWPRRGDDDVIDAEAVEIVEEPTLLPHDHPSRRNGDRPSGWSQSQD